jgi:hypothetical protein
MPEKVQDRISDETLPQLILELDDTDDGIIIKFGEFSFEKDLETFLARLGPGWITVKQEYSSNPNTGDPVVDKYLRWDGDSIGESGRRGYSRANPHGRMIAVGGDNHVVLRGNVCKDGYCIGTQWIDEKSIGMSHYEGGFMYGFDIPAFLMENMKNTTLVVKRFEKWSLAKRNYCMSALPRPFFMEVLC